MSVTIPGMPAKRLPPMRPRSGTLVGMPSDVPPPRPPPSRGRRRLPSSRRAPTMVPPPAVVEEAVVDLNTDRPSQTGQAPDSRRSWTPPPLSPKSSMHMLSAEPTPFDDLPSGLHPTVPSSPPPPVVRSLLPSELDAAMLGWQRLTPLAFAAALGAIILGMLVGSTAPALHALAKTGLSSRAAAVVLELVARDAPATEPPRAEPATPDAVATAASEDDHASNNQSQGQRGVLIASGRGCTFWISGSPYGSASSVRANLFPGTHIVGCRSATGHMLVKSTNVQAGKTAYVQF